MTVEEVNASFDELRAQGATDEDILGVLYLMYQEGKLDTNQLKEMVDILGYEFTPEFEAMSEEDKHVKGFKEDDSAAEGVSKEEVEDAKETGGNEGGEGGGNPEPKNEEEDGKQEGGNEPPKPQDNEPKAEDNKPADDGKSDEEKEKEEAFKLYGFKK